MTTVRNKIPNHSRYLAQEFFSLDLSRSRCDHPFSSCQHDQPFPTPWSGDWWYTIDHFTFCASGESSVRQVARWSFTGSAEFYQISTVTAIFKAEELPVASCGFRCPSKGFGFFLPKSCNISPWPIYLRRQWSHRNPSSGSFLAPGETVNRRSQQNSRTFLTSVQHP